MAAAPPVPTGAVAVDAWRELDRTTRRDLLRSDRPHPDPYVAVVAVGYARAVLSRSRLRRALPFTAVWTTMVIALAVLQATEVLPLATEAAGLAPIVVFVLAAMAFRIFMRSRIIALNRMESVNATHLWQTERPAATPARPAVAPPGPPPTPVVVRYRRAALLRSYAIVTGFVLVVEAMLLIEGGALAWAGSALMAVAVVLTVFNTLARVRPHLPMLIMDTGGITVPAMGARLSWADVTEIRIRPGRGRAGRKGQCVIAFVVTDPGVLLSQLNRWWAARARTSLTANGAPLSIGDAALDHTAEEIAAAAAAFTTAPVRRFGP